MNVIGPSLQEIQSADLESLDTAIAETKTLLKTLEEARDEEEHSVKQSS